MRLTDFDVLTFDMIGTLIDFERGLRDFMRPRLLRTSHEITDTDILAVSLEDLVRQYQLDLGA